MTSHVTYQHDMCVYPSSRGYTYQPLVGGRQVSAARWWMTSALVDQTRENPSGGRALSWSERKIIRAHGQSDTNGELAELPLVDQSKNADHVYAPRASVYSTKINSHLLARDEYPEVIHAEKAAESDVTYSIPHIAPDVMVEWARKLIVNRPARFSQMGVALQAASWKAFSRYMGVSLLHCRLPRCNGALREHTACLQDHMCQSWQSSIS